LRGIKALKKIAFEKKGYDGFLVTNEANVLYFTGFSVRALSPCILVSRTGEPTAYVYSVNYEQVKDEGKEFNVELVKKGENLGAKIADKARSLKMKKLGLDMVAGVPYVADYRQLVEVLKGIAKVEVEDKLVRQLRSIKDQDEIKLMREAGRLTSLGMKAAYETIKPGVREYEVAAQIEYEMRSNGSWGTAFETIVASGVKSAFPHGGCSDRKIKRGDLVIVDIGATCQFYCSDMTRTFIAGNPSEKQKRICKVVKRAQEKALQAIRPKAEAKDVDATARKTIKDTGYGEYFVHGLGHGVGLEVHELPTLSSQSKDKLEIGNVVTVEPGIYMIDFGGVRFEDTVLVGKSKIEKLTNQLYDYNIG